MNKIITWIGVGICFIIPLVLSVHGAWQNYTIGQILAAIYLFAETKLA